MANCATPSNKLRNLQAYESDLRILQVVDLASMAGTEAFESSLDNPLESFVEALLEPKQRCHPSLEPLSEIIRTPGGWPDAADWHEKRDIERLTLAENFATAERLGFHGFGVQLGTPVRKYLSADSYMGGWGFFNTVWVYAENIDDAWLMGMAWASQKNAKAMAEAGFAVAVAHG